MYRGKENSVDWALFTSKLGELNYNELELHLNGVFTPEQDNDKTNVEPVHSYDAFHTSRCRTVAALEEDCTGGDGHGLEVAMDWRRWNYDCMYDWTGSGLEWKTGGGHGLEEVMDWRRWNYDCMYDWTGSGLEWKTGGGHGLEEVEL